MKTIAFLESALLKSFGLLAVLLGSASAEAASRPCEVGREAFSRSLYPRLRDACARCHSEGGISAAAHSSSDVSVAYLAALDYANFADPQWSDFALKISQKHWLKYSPEPVELKADESVLHIQNWYSSGQRDCERAFAYTSGEVDLARFLPAVTSDLSWVEVQFDLGLGLPRLKGCKLSLQVQWFTSDSYRVRNPKGQCLGQRTWVKGVRVLVAGTTLPFENIYDQVEAQLGLQGSLLSSEQMILMARSPGADRMSIAFEYIEFQRTGWRY